MTKLQNHRVNRSRLPALIPNFLDHRQTLPQKDSTLDALLKSQESRINGQQRTIQFLQKTIDCLADELVETRRSVRFIQNVTPLVPKEKK